VLFFLFADRKPGRPLSVVVPSPLLFPRCLQYMGLGRLLRRRGNDSPSLKEKRRRGSFFFLIFLFLIPPSLSFSLFPEVNTSVFSVFKRKGLLGSYGAYCSPLGRLCRRSSRFTLFPGFP